MKLLAEKYLDADIVFKTFRDAGTFFELCFRSLKRQETNWKILIVDDEENILDIISMQIQNAMGCHLFTARTGNEALKILKAHHDIALVLCDFRMPDGNGDVVYRYLRDHAPFIPYFLITGSESPAQHDLFKEFLQHNSSNRYITKPFKCGDLIAEIKAVLNKSK